MFSDKKCCITARYVFSYLPQVELNGFPRNICKRYLCRGHTVNSSTATVKKDFSFANLRISTLRFSAYTECGQMVKYIIGTRLYWNGSNILFSLCKSTM